MNNNIKNNKISEILAKENLKVLNEIKKAEIKNKRLISGQKELLEFFNKLRDIILTEDNNNNSSSNSKSDNNIIIIIMKMKIKMRMRMRMKM